MTLSTAWEIVQATNVPGALMEKGAKEVAREVVRIGMILEGEDTDDEEDDEDEE